MEDFAACGRCECDRCDREREHIRTRLVFMKFEIRVLKSSLKRMRRG